MTGDENVEIAKGVRFALVALIAGLSYPNVNLALGIPAFEAIYKDMLNGRPLPMATVWVLQLHPALVAVAVSIPLLAIGLLLFDRIGRSLYGIGILFVVMFAQFFCTWRVLTIPVFQIIQQMGGVVNEIK